MRTLIVEDREEMRYYLKRVLGDVSSIMFETDNVEEAMEIMRRETLDVVLLDLRLTTTDASETLSKIPLMREANPDAAIIIVTGAMTDDHGKEIALVSGADAFVSKPVPSFTLGEAICSAMKRKRESSMGKEPGRYVEILERVARYMGVKP